MSSCADLDKLPIKASDVHDAWQRIREHLPPTPLFYSPELSDEVYSHLWLKAENLQCTGSFKARGALNWVLTAQAEEMEQGLVTVSAGNHAIALAWAAAQRQIPLTVVMPEGSSPIKIDTTRKLGATVLLRGRIQDAVAYTQELRERRNLTLVHPYNDLRVMAGQGTTGLEMLDQLPDLARVICPIGGGGLICGLGLALKAARPFINVIGVEPEGAATMRNAWDQGDASAALAQPSTVASSLAPAIVGEHTYNVSKAVVDDIVTVSDEAIRAATRELMLKGRLYVEPGAAVGLAALRQGRLPGFDGAPTVLVLTGGNMDAELASVILRDGRGN